MASRDTKIKGLAGTALKFALLSSVVLPGAGFAVGQEADDAVEAVESTETTQDAASDNLDLETVKVTGTRQIIQSTINIKRNATQIVDGLSAEDIGDLPALSIGEALETITGASSHRENGGATEISIRGLGPFLSSTVINGREATNGSGDRSVNFSQFPSELLNKLAIFKTQSAEQIEGGVAGQIQLETLQPLDYGKRRFQFDLKANINPDQLNQTDTLAGTIGGRGSASYVDQFDFDNGGRFGFSVGVEVSDISQPEAEFRTTGPTSNSRPACLITDGNFPITQDQNGADVTGFTNFGADHDDDCDDVNDNNAINSDGVTGITDRGNVEGFNTAINPDTGLAFDDGIPFAFAPSQRHFRQNDTRDQRRAFFGAAQWQPNDRLDFNADIQISERTQSELRYDLTFNGGRENTAPDNGIAELNIGTGTDVSTLDTLIVTDSGAILQHITDNSLEVQGGDFERKETYVGGGLAASFDVSDRLTVSADLSYSQTERTEDAREFRFQSDITPTITFDGRGDVPNFTLTDEVFDVNDHANFVDRLRVRIDNDLERENTVTALRFDGDYDLDRGPFKSIKAGIRYSELEYLALDGGDGGNPGRIEIEFRNDRNETDNNFDARIETVEALSIQTLALANETCRTDFNETNFLGGGNLITNVADDGSIISTTSSFAQFDPNCIADLAVDAVNANGLATDASGNVVTISGGVPSLIEEFQSTIDVNEQTLALYAQSDYETTVADMTLRGNFGLRVVNTEVESIGYRNSFNVIDNAGVFTIAANNDTIQTVAEHDYTEFLPSFTAILDLNDESLVRFGVFRALSRADPADMGFSRTIQIQNQDEDGDITDPDNLVAGVIASGNPEFDPLTSWNFDVGYEYYPNEDTLFAIGAYYKRFIGGFQNIVQNETFTIGGEEVTIPVSAPATSDQESNLYGFEATATHRFSYLPGALSGFGTKLSYNYADSDFEFEDSRYGDLFQTQLDGTVIQSNAGIIAPANIPGLSKHVFSGQLYYQIGKLDLQGIYKYRSEYFQPFTSDGTRIRYVGSNGVVEARASYKITDDLRVTVEGLNLLDEPREDFAFVDDDCSAINQFGPRIFVGLRGKF